MMGFRIWVTIGCFNISEKGKENEIPRRIVWKFRLIVITVVVTRLKNPLRVKNDDTWKRRQAASSYEVRKSDGAVKHNRLLRTMKKEKIWAKYLWVCCDAG